MQPVKTKKKLSRADKKQIEAAIARANRTDKKGKSAQDSASARAVEWLQTSRTMQGAQLAQAKEALSWAARTYLVAALSAIASVLYYVFLILGRRD